MAGTEDSQLLDCMRRTGTVIFLQLVKISGLGLYWLVLYLNVLFLQYFTVYQAVVRGICSHVHCQPDCTQVLFIRWRTWQLFLVNTRHDAHILFSNSHDALECLQWCTWMFKSTRCLIFTHTLQFTWFNGDFVVFLQLPFCMYLVRYRQISTVKIKISLTLIHILYLLELVRLSHFPFWYLHSTYV